MNTTRHTGRARQRVVAALASPLILAAGLSVVSTPAQAAPVHAAQVQDEPLPQMWVPNPTFDGDPTVGVPLTVTTDLSTAPDGAEVTYQWRVFDGGWSDLPGVVGETYTPVASQLSRWVGVTATVRAPGFEDYVAEGSVGPVQAGESDVRYVPTIAGPARAGEEIRVTVTPELAWEDGYQQFTWKRDGEPVENGHQDVYTPTGEDVGHELSVTVMTHRNGYEPQYDDSEPVEVLPGTLPIETPYLSDSHPEVDLPVEFLMDTSAAPQDTTTQVQWGTVVGEGDECQPTEGETEVWHTPTIAEMGKRLCVIASASALGYDDYFVVVTGDNAVVGGSLPMSQALLNTTAPWVGNTLRISVSTYDALPSGAKTTVAWGYAPVGTTCRPTKTASSLKVTSAMVGRRVCARTTVSAPGFETWTSTTTTKVVTEPSRVTAPRTVKGTTKFTVRAQGLAPKQKYRIVGPGISVRGTADSYGRLSRSVKFSKKAAKGWVTVTVQGLDSRGRVTWSQRTSVNHRK